MPTYLCHADGKWFAWSTIVDAPTTYGGTIEDLAEYIAWKFPDMRLSSFVERTATARERGTDAPNQTLAELVSWNRAGHGETCLTLEEIKHIYVHEGRAPVEGEGREVEQT